MTHHFKNKGMNAESQHGHFVSSPPRMNRAKRVLETYPIAQIEFFRSHIRNRMLEPPTPPLDLTIEKFSRSQLLSDYRGSLGSHWDKQNCDISWEKHLRHMQCKNEPASKAKKEKKTKMQTEARTERPIVLNDYSANSIATRRTCTLKPGFH